MKKELTLIALLLIILTLASCSNGKQFKIRNIDGYGEQIITARNFEYLKVGDRVRPRSFTGDGIYSASQLDTYCRWEIVEVID